MNESGIHPTGTKILVKPVETERVTEGGIVIPESEAKKYDDAGFKAEIIEIGPCAFQNDIEHFKYMEKGGFVPKVGDYIYMAKWAGKTVLGRGGDYRIINDEDVTAVLEDKDVGGNSNF